MNMKSFRFAIAAVVMLLCAVGFAQTDAQKPIDAQKSFDALKALAGTWQAIYEGKPMQASLRVTSMGHAIVHEMKGDGPENPITMFYLEGDRLMLTHYCDAGNQPRMVGKLSPDGKTLDFNFVAVGNYSPAQGGHMQHAVFTFIDANHHTEEWTFMIEGGKPAEHARLDLERKN
jgi:hypothetical protein